jgi:hypothetical protein
MSNQPLPVKGYTPLNDAKVALANEGKEIEERYMRWLEKIEQQGEVDICPRFVALARTNIQQGAMWAIRSIFQPTRIKLPEDN